MRHAYNTPGLTDSAALVKFARERDEDTTIHLHPFDVPYPVDCHHAGCYVIEGKRREQA